MHFAIPATAQAIMIADCNGLQAIKGNLGATYQLGNNIDCSATASWNAGAGFSPLGNSTSPFLGVFDGKGFKISNLTINRPSASGVSLFGYIGSSAQISSVGLVGGAIQGQTSVGGLVGYNNGGTVSDVYASGFVSAPWGDVGGLIGYSEGGMVSNSYAAGSVSGSIIVGGLVGSNSNGMVSNSYATSSVSVSLANSAYSYGGGLVGWNSGTVSNAYATGSVSSSGSGYAASIGGLVGYNSGGTVSNAYATGPVAAGSGLVGKNTGAVIYAYWDINTSGQRWSQGGTGLSTAFMQQVSNFVSWDFYYTWAINPGKTYPLLQVFVRWPSVSTPLSNVTATIGSPLTLLIPVNSFMDSNGLQLEYTATLLYKRPLPVWLVFDASTQTFLGTPLSGAQGTFDIEVSAYNTPSKFVKDVFRLTIPNRAPRVQTLIPTQQAFNGQFFQLIIPEAVFLDDDGDRLQLSASTVNGAPWPTWLSFNAVLGIFSGTSTLRGTYAMNVTVNDNFAGQVSTAFDIITPNSAPQVVNVFPNQVLLVGQAFQFTVPASVFADRDGDLLRYSATVFGGADLLPWLQFDANAIAFSGTPPLTGFLMVSIIASDPYNATTTLNFGISVTPTSNNAPPLVAIQMLDQTVVLNQPFQLQLPDNMFVDPDGDPLTYSATLEGGAALPTWLVFNNLTRTFSGVPPLASLLRLTVHANDGRGGFALNTFALTIKDNTYYPPIVLNTLPNQVATVGEAYQFGIPSGTFSDPNDNPLTYTAAQAGNQSLPRWLRFDPNTLAFRGKPGREDTGTFSDKAYRLQVTASDGLGSTSATFDLFVQGDSTVQYLLKIFGPLATLASICFTIYETRAWLWNHLCRRWYQLPKQTAIIDQGYRWEINLPKVSVGKRINRVQAFKDNYKLPNNKLLPDWLLYETKSISPSLQGTPLQEDFDRLTIRVYGYDERILAEFELGIFQKQTEADAFMNKPKQRRAGKWCKMCSFFSSKPDTKKELLLEKL